MSDLEKLARRARRYGRVHRVVSFLSKVSIPAIFVPLVTGDFVIAFGMVQVFVSSTILSMFTERAKVVASIEYMEASFGVDDET